MVDVGDTFGDWTVIDAAPIKGGRRWFCRCVCGTQRVVYQAGLIAGRTESCGCGRSKRVAKAFTTHGGSHSPEWNSWAGMKSRCSNPKDKAYKYYGAKGVKVCNEWKDSFAAFLADMGTRPDPRHSLDRINPAGGYKPSNCRWATRKTQARNTRMHHKNKRGCTGVYWGESRKCYQVLIGVNGRNIHVGRYRDFFDACCARKSAENLLWGEER